MNTQYLTITLLPEHVQRLLLPVQLHVVPARDYLEVEVCKHFAIIGILHIFLELSSFMNVFFLQSLTHVLFAIYHPK